MVLQFSRYAKSWNLIFPLSGLGAACLELMFYLSMYGELLMARFLFFYAMHKSKAAV